MAITKLENLINPQVMAEMVQFTLPKKIKIINYAKVDNTLVGQPGDTVTIPTYAYAGDAGELLEGGTLDTTLLTTTTTNVTIKQIGKALEITDSAVLSAYGDPLGQACTQLGAALASKIDTDAIEALDKAVLHKQSEGVLNYEAIVDAVGLLEEEDDEGDKVLFITPNQVTQLRKDPDFRDINRYPLPVSYNGVIGTIAGCQVVVTKRLKDEGLNTVNYIIKPGALTLYLKTEPIVETDRDILKKTTVITGAQHYAVALTDVTKAVKLTVVK